MLLSMFRTAFSEWQKDRAATYGAALAFYTLLSLAPFVILLLSITGLVWGEEAVRGELYGQLRGIFGEEGAKTVESMVAASSKPTSNIFATIVGIVTLLLGATAVFGQLQQAMNAVWDVERTVTKGIIGLIRERWISFSMLLVFGFLFIVSLLLSALINLMSERYSGLLPFSAVVLEIINASLGFLIMSILFGAMYKILAGVQLRWRDVAWGGIVTAALFVLGKTLLGLYLGHAAPASSYGAAGAVIVIPIWIYYSSQIFLYGAELTQVHTRKNRIISPRAGFHNSKDEPPPTLRTVWVKQDKGLTAL